MSCPGINCLTSDALLSNCATTNFLNKNDSEASLVTGMFRKLDVIQWAYLPRLISPNNCNQSRSVVGS